MTFGLRWNGHQGGNGAMDPKAGRWADVIRPSFKLQPCFLATILLVLGTLLSPAWANSAVAPAQKSHGASCDRARFRVVLDVGHSAEIPGALSARGVPEYEFNLRLANQIGKALIGAGFAKTSVLVTPGPARAGLFTRVAHANGLPADLLISIHHDSVPERFLESWEYEGKPSRFCDRFRGHSIFISRDNAHWEAGLHFARLLGKRLKARGLKYASHYAEEFMQERRRELVDAEAGVYRYDQLIVLKDTTMPAVLLEAGSILHRDEELLLQTPARQALVSAAVTEAVKSFCAARSPAQPKQQASR